MLRRIKYRLLDRADRIRYRLTCWWGNIMFFCQQEDHWLHTLLTPLRILWLAGRLLIGLTRGIGPAATEDDASADDFTA